MTPCQAEDGLLNVEEGKSITMNRPTTARFREESWRWRAICSSSFEVLHSNHGWARLYNGQGTNSCQRLGDGGIGGVVNHQDQRHALALVTFGLYHRGDADLRAAQNGGDFGERSRFVNDA